MEVDQELTTRPLPLIFAPGTDVKLAQAAPPKAHHKKTKKKQIRQVRKRKKKKINKTITNKIIKKNKIKNTAPSGKL